MELDIFNKSSSLLPSSNSNANNVGLGTSHNTVQEKDGISRRSFISNTTNTCVLGTFAASGWLLTDLTNTTQWVAFVSNQNLSQSTGLPLLSLTDINL